MSKGAASLIADAKLRGQRVIGETIASGIAAVEGKIWDPDFKVCIAVSEPTLNNCCYRRYLTAIESDRLEVSLELAGGMSHLCPSIIHQDAGFASRRQRSM